MPLKSFFNASSRLWILGGLIISVTLFRFWYTKQLELTGDEAYYWYCSRHLDWSFFDKGPGAAVTIFFGTHLFGDTVFGVRFFAVLLSLATGLGLFVLAKILYNEKVAFWTLMVVLLIPLYAVGSILMTIDPLSIFFWTCGAICFWKAVNVYSGLTISSGIFWWVLAGVSVGLGMLAKYTNLVELLCFALFCFWSPKQRLQLRRFPFYLMVAVAFAFSLPMIIWNYQHHWIGVMHLLQRGDLNKSWHVTPSELLVFIGAQAGVISPLIFLGVMFAVLWPQCAAGKREQTQFLQSLFLPLFGFYSFLSLNKAAEPNWPAPCYVAGIILLVGNWESLKKRVPWVRKLVLLAFLIAALETILLHNTFWLHLPVPAAWEETSGDWTQKVIKVYHDLGAVDPLDRARGAQSIANHAEAVAQEQGTIFFISDNYQTASLLSFYLKDHPDTYEPAFDHVKDQFSLWPSYRDQFPVGSKALFIYLWRYPPREILNDFSTVETIEEAYSTTGKRPLKKYYYSTCEGLKVR
ncbi:MAG: ArnT family glycosyltransferase [Chthoniobacterales bacterium]